MLEVDVKWAELTVGKSTWVEIVYEGDLQERLSREGRHRDGYSLLPSLLHWGEIIS